MSAEPVLHGIKACDTMKKARVWLEGHGVAYGFHDYKASGVTREMLERWSAKVGWDVLLNRAGTTFRALPDADRQGVDQARAIDLMIAQPSMIKRPVLEFPDGRVVVGFKPERYAEAFA